jgi:hypothetical protein
VPCPLCFLRTIEVADIDGDGHSDLVIGDSKWTYSDVAPPLSVRGGHTILFGEGNGSFGSPADVRGGSGELCGIGDFDGDPHVDLVVDAERCFGSASCEPPPAFDLLRGNGNGSFVAAGKVAGTGGACGIAVLDHDGDGLDDVAATVGTELRIVRGSSGGAFLPAAHHPAGLAACRIEWDDFDGDGLREFVLGSSSRAISLFPDRRAGGADVPRLIPTIHEATLPVAGSFDGDGRLDLATASNEEGSVAVLHGRGDTSFDPLQGRRVATGGSTTALAVSDLDLDGDLDVAAAHLGDSVAVLLGDGAGHLTPGTQNPVGTDPRAIAAGLVNSIDVVPDLVVLNQTDLSVLLALGAAGFAPEIRIALEPNPRSMVLADFNSDGLADLALSHGAPTNVVTVRLGRGDGTFSGSRSQAVGNDPRHLAAADVNGDGRLDLLTANYLSADVSVLRGAPFGNFLAETRVSVGGSPEFVTASDLDRDARFDLVVSQGSIAVLRGNGDGSFGAAAVLDAGDNYRNARAVGDFDGDTRPDLAGWGAKSHTATVLRGEAGPSFEALGAFGVPGAPQSLAAADLDEDGRPDLLLGTADSFVAVLINRGPTTMGFAADKTTLGWPYIDGAASYEVYRGALSSLVDGDHDGLPDSGYGACLGESSSVHNEWVDPAVPAPGAGFYYLVATVDVLGQRDLGTTSAGLARVPGTVCP